MTPNVFIVNSARLPCLSHALQAFLGLVLLLTMPRAEAAAPYVTERTVAHHGQVTVNQVFYLSDGLLIEGRLFVPKSPSGPLPGVVYAHDGVSGLSHSSVERCEELADHGYVVLAPSYRGEDGSQGHVEVAQGEIDDVLAAGRALQQTPGVDAHRLAAIGTSHGALIVVLAAERSDMFRAIVEGYGVMDIYGWWRYLKSQGYSVDDPLSRRVYGRGPDDRPAAFANRDALRDVSRLQAPVLIVQGGADETVPPQQADRFAHALAQSGRPFAVLRYAPEPHGFLIYPGGEASNERRRQAWNHIVTFLQQNLH